MTRGGAEEARDAVVLLHGLARTPRSMARLAARVRAAGYVVHNLGYPSTAASMATLTRGLRAVLEQRVAAHGRLHFVTYSLGAIVVRSLLAEWRPAALGRVVMIAPPSRGSELVDVLRRVRVLRWLYGPVFAHLGTDAASLPNRLGAVDFEVGVIAGSRVISPVGWWLLPGPSDGTVPVVRTRLAGMTDHIVLPHAHPFMMNAPAVAAETMHFLRHGRFSAGAPRRIDS